MSSVHQDVLTQPHVPGLPSVRGFGARLGAAAYLVLETLADWQQRATERAPTPSWRRRSRMGHPGPCKRSRC